MKDLTKLASRLRSEAKEEVEIDEHNRLWSSGVNYAAHQLENTLPRPTMFTTDPLSWPDQDQDVMCRFKDGNIEVISWDSSWELGITNNDEFRMVNGTWWPLNGLFGENDE